MVQNNRCLHWEDVYSPPPTNEIEHEGAKFTSYGISILLLCIFTYTYLHSYHTSCKSKLADIVFLLPMSTWSFEHLGNFQSAFLSTLCGITFGKRFGTRFLLSCVCACLPRAPAGWHMGSWHLVCSLPVSNEALPSPPRMERSSCAAGPKIKGGSLLL